jgi:hypothetical protein
MTVIVTKGYVGATRLDLDMGWAVNGQVLEATAALFTQPTARLVSYFTVVRTGKSPGFSTNSGRFGRQTQRCWTPLKSCSICASVIFNAGAL